MRKKLSGDGRQSLLDYWTDYCGGRAGYGGYLVGEREKSEQSVSQAVTRKVGWAGVVPSSCPQDTRLGKHSGHQSGSGRHAGCKWMGPKQVGQRMPERQEGRKASVDLTWTGPESTVPSFLPPGKSEHPGQQAT